MTASLKLVSVVAAAVAIAVGGLYFLAPSNVGGPVATPTPAASPSASATPAPIDPATWVPYTSERFGYTVDHPADWTITPSRFDWEPGTIHSEESQWPDQISDPGGGYLGGGYTIYAGRQDLETGQTPESWIEQYITDKALDAGGVCGDISTAQYEPVDINGETGQRIEMVCAGVTFYTAAIVVHDGSGYLVAVATPSNSRDEWAVELFDAVLASFRFAAS